MDVLAPLPCSLRQLQYLVAVADLGGFSRAAARCNVSQPSLSAQVAFAEDALGLRVFERDRRGVRVSSAGGVIIERARQVLVAAHELADTARHQADPFSGVLRIGVIPTVSPYLLPEVTPALRANYPRLSIVWTEDKTAVLVSRIQEGSLDAAVIASKVPPLESADLLEDRFVVAAAPHHRLMRSRKPLAPSGLADQEVLLLDEGHCLRDQALALCSRAGVSEAGYRATSLATLVQMVVHGNAVTLLPEMALAVENRRSQLAVRQFTKPVPSRTLVLAWRRGSALDSALRAVAEVIRDAAR